MYGYGEYVDISPEQLLQKVTQEQIFEFILDSSSPGTKFDFSLRYTSPFRSDKKPGCRFEQRPDGTILFVDFGEKLLNPTKTHRSCFRMVMDFYDVSLNTALKIICDKFSLSKSSNDYQRVDVTYTNKSFNSPVLETIIKYDKRQYGRFDIQHWSKFLIKTSHLEEDKVFSVRRFTINGPKGISHVAPYKHCYAIDFIDKVKIYQPYSVDYKWITNCDENNIGNFDNLPLSGDELIIKKSYKDHRVMRNLDMGLDVIWFQNEGCIPSIDILVSIVSRFKLITIFFDNDEGGIKAAIVLVAIFNSIREGCARMVYLPTLHLKDPSEFINKEGRRDLITVINQIGIYGKNT